MAISLTTIEWPFIFFITENIALKTKLGSKNHFANYKIEALIE